MNHQRARLIFRLLSLLFLTWALAGLGIPAPAVRWTAAVAGLALALLSLSQGTAWQMFGRWTALALIGQACALQLLDVGTANRLQLFHEWGRILITYRVVFLGMVFLQAALVAWEAGRCWKQAWPRVRSLFSPIGALVFLLLCCFAAVPVAAATVQAFIKGDLLFRLVAQVSKLGLGLVVLGVGTLNLAFAAAEIPADGWDRIVTRWQRIHARRVVQIAAIWTVVISTLLFWFVMDRLPHLPDDIAYLFHARYFAAGKLYLPLPPEPQAFSCGLVLMDGQKWYSAQLPGWPAVLAIGAWAGVPWLVNPLLAGLTIALAYVFIKRLYDEQVAVVSALLLAGSPWLLYMSATYMGHPVSVALSLVALLAVQRARETGDLLAAAGAGLAMGFLALTRPLEALVLVLPLGIWWLSTGWKRLRIAALAVTAVCGLAVGALLPAYNFAVTGSARTMPFEKVTDLSLYTGANRLGFGRDVGNFGWEHLDPLPGHGPADVLVNTNHNLYMVQFELFGWACGSLLFVFLLLTWKRWRQDLLMWGLTIAIWGGMSTYWFSGGPDFGARYWYQMIVPFAVLTVRGAQAFAVRWDAATPDRSSGTGNRVWAFVALASLLGFLNVVPWRAIDKYKGYRGVSGEVRQLARENNFGRSLVFLRGEKLGKPWASSVYASGFALNPLPLDVDTPGPIYVRDLGEESRERLRRFYPTRPVWILADPELTGHGFRVLEGPLPPWNALPPDVPR